MIKHDSERELHSYDTLSFLLYFMMKCEVIWSSFITRICNTCHTHTQAKTEPSTLIITPWIQMQHRGEEWDGGSCAVPGKQRLETCRGTSQAARSLSCWSLDTEKDNTWEAKDSISQPSWGFMRGVKKLISLTLTTTYPFCIAAEEGS